MRHFLKALILCICLILQSTIFQFLGIRGIVPNLLLAGVISVAMTAGSDLEALGYGLGAGVVYDLLWGRVFGINALLMMYIAVGAYYAAGYVYRKNITVGAAFAFLASLIYDILFYVLSFTIFGNGKFLFVMFRIIIPAAAYTAVLQVIIYPVIGKVQRIDSEGDDEI